MLAEVIPFTLRELFDMLCVCGVMRFRVFASVAGFVPACARGHTGTSTSTKSSLLIGPKCRPNVLLECQGSSTQVVEWVSHLLLLLLRRQLGVVLFIPDPLTYHRIVHKHWSFTLSLTHTDHVGVLFAVSRFWLQGARDKTRERERVRWGGCKPENFGEQRQLRAAQRRSRTHVNTTHPSTLFRS